MGSPPQSVKFALITLCWDVSSPHLIAQRGPSPQPRNQKLEVKSRRTDPSRGARTLPRPRRPGALRERDDELRELSGGRLHPQGALVPLHHDLVAEGEPEPRALAGGLRREEGIEDALRVLRLDAGPVVADA